MHLISVSYNLHWFTLFLILFSKAIVVVALDGKQRGEQCVSQREVTTFSCRNGNELLTSQCGYDSISSWRLFVFRQGLISWFTYEFDKILLLILSITYIYLSRTDWLFLFEILKLIQSFNRYVILDTRWLMTHDIDRLLYVGMWYFFCYSNEIYLFFFYKWQWEIKSNVYNYVEENPVPCLYKNL